MIKLQDFLGIADLELNKYKIHFARGGVRPEEAKEIFYAGEFQSWQERQTKKNFEREYVIRLWVYAILKNFSPIRFKWNEAATFFNKN